MEIQGSRDITAIRKCLESGEWQIPPNVLATLPAQLDRIARNVDLVDGQEVPGKWSERAQIQASRALITMQRSNQLGLATQANILQQPPDAPPAPTEITVNIGVAVREARAHLVRDPEFVEFARKRAADCHPRGLCGPGEPAAEEDGGARVPEVDSGGPPAAD